jgi:hypothetical protein
VSRPRFARRVRGRRALTLAFAPRLIIQLSGGCQILTSTNRAPSRSAVDGNGALTHRDGAKTAVLGLEWQGMYGRYNGCAEGR